eukprot:529151-Amphidinium_carterae.1
MPHSSAASFFTSRMVISTSKATSKFAKPEALKLTVCSMVADLGKLKLYTNPQAACAQIAAT